MDSKKLKKYPFYITRRVQTEEHIETEIEATSWSEARDLLGRKCDADRFKESEWEGTATTGIDYAVHLMHTGDAKHEAAMQERKEIESRDESIFHDCVWDGDYW